ncbi:DUF2058 domain-containing protein [Psychrobacter sp.]|uniref:DUF2058 domain-containing protein n=1 Tax=Psychrobacter sp. TaxID=56811 RepID=UPI0025F757BA|nr:DUF2058 domain-containing protein [Psychrobacter sp.]
MAKNALQDQLLKAGLVDNKKAKKLTKQAQHAKRTGNGADADIKQSVAQAQAEKLERDQKLNQQKQQALEDKTLRANIVQMIQQHQITEIEGDTEYRFVDDSKIKKMNLTQKLFDQIVAGHVSIARLEDGYALLPRPLADRINEKLEGFIVESKDKAENEPAEDDPYAAYVIPDDLMW